MELGNYKIKVKTEAESREAQELFFELGYYWRTGLGVKNLDAKFLFVKNNKIMMGFCSDNFSNSDYCELTITQLRDLVAQSKNKQCLISGADALRALADGKEVECSYVGDWLIIDLKTELGIFHRTDVTFRLKPRTITLNIEIPAPFEPKEYEDRYMLTDLCEHGYTRTSREYSKSVPAWRTEDEIKQVVASLRGALKNG